MFKIFIIAILAVTFLLITGCDKEKTVTSTEYVKEVEYVELPPDTVFLTDTIVDHSSDTVNATDTVVLYDTTIQTIVDTVVTVEQHFDTITIVDTVLDAQCSPNEHLAFAALQYYTDPLVMDLINQEFGYTDGWIFYLSEFQSDMTAPSSGTYDIYGYIDYWTVDWSGYYPLEYYWRLSFTGGDPTDPQNWDLSEPTGGASPGARSGLTVFKDSGNRHSITR